MTIDNNLIIVGSLLLLAFMCLLIVMFIVVLFLRITGRGIIPLILSLRQQLPGIEEEEPIVTSKSRPNLRAIAEQHDFNAALAQQVIVNQHEQPTPPPITPQNAPYVSQVAPTPLETHIHTPPPTFVAPPPNTVALTPTTPIEPREPDVRLGSRRHRDEGRRREIDDEVFGAMLDDDGDGNLDP